MIMGFCFLYSFRSSGAECLLEPPGSSDKGSQVQKYTLYRKADEYIRDIWKYTVEKWDEEQAEVYLSDLE